MKNTLSVLAFTIAISYLFTLFASGYTTTSKGIKEYSCLTYKQPLDCVK